jgi:hypothetical protein
MKPRCLPERYRPVEHPEFRDGERKELRAEEANMFDAIEHEKPECHHKASDDLEQLLHPASCFASPMHVVRAGSLSLAEKRAILSAWASDACAIEAMPALRQVPGAPSPVTFDEIMDALQLLDREWRTRAIAKTTKAKGDRTRGGGLHFG